MLSWLRLWGCRDDFIKSASMVPHSAVLPFDPTAVSTKDACLQAEKETLTRVVKHQICQDHCGVMEGRRGCCRESAQCWVEDH